MIERMDKTSFFILLGFDLKNTRSILLLSLVINHQSHHYYKFTTTLAYCIKIENPIMAIVCSYCPPELKPSEFLGRTSTFLEKVPFQHMKQNYRCRSRINALFWGSRKAVEQSDGPLSLGTFSLTGSGSEKAVAESLLPKKVSISVISSISEVSSEEWDACSVDTNGPEKFNPFLSHGFLSSLEESDCSVKETGWTPRHVIAKDEVDNIIGVVPLYLKSHSYGEYVFDHSWANAYYSYGSRYYPKLQSCVPFTPVTGPRILLRNTAWKDEVFDIIVSALKDLTSKFQVSSMHVTFSTESQWNEMKEKGFLQRIGMQYHWKNRNYKE
ncbi:ETS translocation variant 2 [Bienertia sinuspersici]